MASVYELGLLADAVYDDAPQVEGWTLVQFLRSRGMGSLQAGLFTKGQEKVVAFKGTSEATDVVVDLKIGSGMNSSYYSEAEQFCAQYASSVNVVCTGHSLGGGIAQTVGNRRRLPFASFNAPGVAIMASRNMASATVEMSAVRLVGGLLSTLRHPHQAMRDMKSAFYTVEGLNFRLSGDIVSGIGLHYGPIVTLQGSGNPLDQHKMGTMLGVLDSRGYRNVPFST